MRCQLGFVTTIKCYLVRILAVHAQGDQEEAHHEEGVRGVEVREHQAQDCKAHHKVADDKGDLVVQVISINFDDESKAGLQSGKDLL